MGRGYVVLFDSRMAYREVWELQRTPETLILCSSAADLIDGCHCFSSVASEEWHAQIELKGTQEAAPPGAVALSCYENS